MRCPLCDAENDASAEACFTCGRAFDALTHGLVLSGRYEVRRPLGSGGMGRVYEAYDRVLEEPVAIKVLRAELTGDPDISRRFLTETRLARKVSHRNVCRIHEYGEAQGLAYISMEFIEGRSLKELLAGQRPSLSDAFELSLQVAEGLAAIHEHGIVHRDFKSGNIMVNAAGVAKILDFGIAKQVGEGAVGLTAGDRVFGTPEYMSPEQVEGSSLDARSDIYALGCVVYEIFTGRPPFRGDTPYATLLKQLKEPPPLDALPPGLLRPLVAALAKDRTQRFASVGDFITALRAARDVALPTTRPNQPRTLSTSRAAPDTSGPRNTVTIFRLPSFRKQRARWAWAVAAVSIVAIGALIGLGGGGSPVRPALTPGVSVAPPPTTAFPTTAPEATTSAPPPSSAAPAHGRSETPTSVPTTTRPPQPSANLTSQPVPERRSAPVATPVPSTLAAATALPIGGTLVLIVVPDSEVVLDGASIGRVGRRDIPLSVGAHQLEVLHPDYEPLPRRFMIRLAQTYTLLLDLQEKGIRKAPKKK